MFQDGQVPASSNEGSPFLTSRWPRGRADGARVFLSQSSLLRFGGGTRWEFNSGHSRWRGAVRFTYWGLHLEICLQNAACKEQGRKRSSSLPCSRTPAWKTAPSPLLPPLPRPRPLLRLILPPSPEAGLVSLMNLSDLPPHGRGPTACLTIRFLPRKEGSVSGP